LLYWEGEMSVLKLTREEIFAVVGTCDLIRIEDCTPPTLKNFICRRLEETQPALAKTLVPKVADLDEWQMAELCEYIRETHRLMVRRSRRLRRLNGQPGGGR
jgi:hypothetical protein